jgi:hypothetical protein
MKKAKVDASVVKAFMPPPAGTTAFHDPLENAAHRGL